MPVTTTRLRPFELTLSHRLPNVGHQAVLDRVAGDPDRAFQGLGVGPPVGHDGDAVDPEQRRPTELAPDHALPDPTHYGPDKQAPQEARRPLREHTTKAQEDV